MPAKSAFLDLKSGVKSDDEEDACIKYRPVTLLGRRWVKNSQPDIDIVTTNVAHKKNFVSKNANLLLPITYWNLEVAFSRKIITNSKQFWPKLEAALLGALSVNLKGLGPDLADLNLIICKPKFV